MRGVEVVRLGQPDLVRRVTPTDIDACDAVVTIGKTTQYAMRAGKPHSIATITMAVLGGYRRTIAMRRR